MEFDCSILESAGVSGEYGDRKDEKEEDAGYCRYDGEGE